ncbi:hypothetical protein BBK14_23860 [Parafrankia soli]|uniref:Effector-associated domain-containing protein n=1 Tax=Parafrankia soli TaxID=2599596 RepID=A0A1S1PRN4_9ACTN|nr:hypothetical protein [Parafrankia soli]OHV23899.1 hypothetical protein BBK14_23860 [Parafrankia soli]
MSTQPPEGTTAPADLSCSFRGTLVDVLDAAPGFAGTSARRLLRDRIARRLGPGRRLHLVEYDMTRLWFIALVDELAEEPGGLAALSRAVSDLQPGSRLAAEVARIVAAGAAGGERSTADDRAGAARAGTSPPGAQVGGCGPASPEAPPPPPPPPATAPPPPAATVSADSGPSGRVSSDLGVTVPPWRCPSAVSRSSWWSATSRCG